MNELTLVAPIGFLLLAVLLWLGRRFDEPCARYWAAAWLSLWLGGLLQRLDPGAQLLGALGAAGLGLAPWLFLAGTWLWAGATPPSWWPLAPAGSVLVRLSVLVSSGTQAALWAGAALDVAVLIGCVEIARRAWARERPAPGPLLMLGFVMYAAVVAIDPPLQSRFGRLSGVTIALWNVASFSFIWLQIGGIVDRARRRATRKLRRSEAELQRAQSLAQLGSWEMDVDTGVMHWSDQNAVLFGYEPGQIEPTVQLFLERVHPEDRSAMASSVSAALERREAIDIHFRVVTPAGKLRHLHGLGDIGRDPQSGHTLLTGATQDVTERVEIERELASYRGHLEDLVEARTAELESSRKRLRRSERLASVGTLAAGIAHQLNNPLAAILTAAQYARGCEGDPDWSEAARRALEEAEREAQRSGAIIRNLLRFATGSPPERQLESLGAIARRACAMTESYAAKSGSRLELDLGDDRSLVSASGIELEQVIVNLLCNAVESCPEGAQIDVRVQREGDECVLEVRDDGCGIPADAVERVFDPFYTTRMIEGGTGLGLAVAHGIVSDLGGRIELQSEPGRGTTVSVHLPASAPPT